MILNFAHGGLQEVFLQGSSASIDAHLAEPCRLRLFILQGATCDADIRMRGLTVRPRAGAGGVQELPFMNRCIMFRWNGRNADDVDFA